MATTGGTYYQAAPSPMTNSYVSSSRGSSRSCGFQSSAASSTSTHRALLSISSIYSLVPTRDLFAIAASVVPKLRAVVDDRMEKTRTRSSVYQSKQSLSCWVEKTKHHGALIHEFDRAKLPSMTHLNGLDSSNTPFHISHTVIESRGSPLHTRDALVRDFTSAVETRKLLHWPRHDPNVTYAVSTQVTINCRLEEALTMLFSRDTLQFDASMSALFGARKYKRGKLLVSHEFHNQLAGDSDERDATDGDDQEVNGLSQPHWLALQSVVLRSRRSLNPMIAARRTSRRQRLCFAVYSQHCPSTNEAFYTMRTVPKPIHHQFTGMTDPRSSSGQAIRHDVDHLAVGYHLTSSYSDLNGYQTSIVMTAYVCNAPASRTTDVSKMRSTLWPKSQSPDGSVSSRRPAVANAEAKYVVNLLAKATASFERLVHRRRLGSQPFIYVPTSREPAPSHSCTMCRGIFGLLRPQRACHLCAQRVCRECSRKFDVEPMPRRVRRNRICFTCVAKVDASVFQSENPLLNTSLPPDYSATTQMYRASTTSWDGSGRTISRGKADISTAFVDDVVDSYEIDRQPQLPRTAKAAAPSQGQMHWNRSNSAATSTTSFSSTNGRQLADALCSTNVSTRARALEVLRHVVKHVTSNPAGATSTRSTSPSSSSNNPSTATFQSQPDSQLVDKYLEARRHLTSISLTSDRTMAASSHHISNRHSFSSYQDEIDRRRYNTSNDQCFASSVISTRSSFVSRPWAYTTANIATELDSDEALDSAALDSISEVAALRMRCSIAYIVALNGTHSSHAQRVVGMFGATRSWTENRNMCPQSLMSTGKPFVVRDARLDAQFQPLRLVQEIGVRFFVGFPIKSPDNTVVACLCAVSAQARDNVSLEDLRAMHALAKLASDLFEEEVNPYTPRTG
ncbi:hypothetical protein PsorP6_008130 [Peronosclerospora sorghi]|uniref:Uncharacterized protein n=1 Tax=Peronosclerospora sorghi TaxID=230839 RepID=A0ACC0W918_9STRA|nr:hypothetical protein PsorP6_008130 [Peronosclerospora sorghi]